MADISYAEVAIHSALAYVDYTVDNPKIIYPDESIKAKQAGITVLRVLVTVTGEAKEIGVEKSSIFKRLDQAALATVKGWRFIPHLVNGTPVEDWTNVTVRFADEEVVTTFPKQINKNYWHNDQHGCKLFDTTLPGLGNYEWNGACSDGYLEGPGELKVSWDGKFKGLIRGSYQKGLLNGKGYIKSTFSEYNGDFSYGLKHGKGVETWEDGTHYEGEYSNTFRHGQGALSWSNGVRIEGKFESGKSEGHEFVFPDIVSSLEVYYPEGLNSHNRTGNVTLEGLLDETGVLSKVKILKSDHPAFEKEIFKVLVNKKFKPATVDGKAIPINFLSSFNFGSRSERSKPYSVVFDSTREFSEENSGLIKAEDLATFSLVAPLVYPLELMQKNERGKVVARVMIDPAGHAAEIKIIEATHPDFASASKAMLASSVFKPAMKNNNPTWASLHIEHVFSRSSKDTIFDKQVFRLLRISEDKNFHVYKLADLDQQPQAIHMPLPELPVGYKVKGGEKVLVEFYIDKTGAVQLPHVLKTNYPELGWLALTTVSRWYFKPPQIKGEPVDVLVSVPVIYSAASN